MQTTNSSAEDEEGWQIVRGGPAGGRKKKQNKKNSTFPNRHKNIQNGGGFAYNNKRSQPPNGVAEIIPTEAQINRWMTRLQSYKFIVSQNLHFQSVQLTPPPLPIITPVLWV